MKTEWTKDEAFMFLSRVDYLEQMFKHQREFYSNIPSIASDFHLAQIQMGSLKRIIEQDLIAKEVPAEGGGGMDWYKKEQS